MAQVTGGSDFDGVWEECSNASLMLLREASDTFAKAGENAIAADAVVASLLALLAMPRPTNFYWDVRNGHRASLTAPHNHRLSRNPSRGWRHANNAGIAMQLLPNS
jgi:hypothetical protein